MAIPKNCTGCMHFIYCWDEQWYEGKNWCYRDKEHLTTKKVEENKNENKQQP